MRKQGERVGWRAHSPCSCSGVRARQQHPHLLRCARGSGLECGFWLGFVASESCQLVQAEVPAPPVPTGQKPLNSQSRLGQRSVDTSQQQHPPGRRSSRSCRETGHFGLPRCWGVMVERLFIYDQSWTLGSAVLLQVLIIRLSSSRLTAGLLDNELLGLRQDQLFSSHYIANGCKVAFMLQILMSCSASVLLLLLTSQPFLLSRHQKEPKGTTWRHSSEQSVMLLSRRSGVTVSGSLGEWRHARRRFSLAAAPSSEEHPARDSLQRADQTAVLSNRCNQTRSDALQMEGDLLRPGREDRRRRNISDATVTSLRGCGFMHRHLCLFSSETHNLCCSVQDPRMDKFSLR